MTFFALCLVLVAALVHATWNYYLKKANANRTFWWVVYWLTASLTLPLLLIFNFEAFRHVTVVGWMVIALSAPIHVCYGVVLQQGYRQSDYSIVYPTARGTGPLISVLAAIFILGNEPTIWGGIGILSILISIVLLTFPGLSRGPTKAELSVKKGILWGTLTGLFIAGYTFCDAWAVQQATGLTPITFYFPSLLVRALIFTPFIVVKKTWHEEVKELFRSAQTRTSLIIVSVGSPLAFILVLYALTLSPLAYVAPTREVGMMLGVIIGGMLLKERMSCSRILGVLGMTLGVVMIAFAG